MKRHWFLMTSIALAAARSVSAQFAPAFLQNDSYWGDG
jgi:hypothetical protein